MLFRSSIVGNRPLPLYEAELLTSDAYIEQMEKNIAAALKISEDQINVKATTEEGLGFTGTEQGISAQAICALTTIYESSVSVADSAGGCAGCPGRACGR